MAYNIVISKEAQVELEFADCYFRTKNLEKAFRKDFLEQLKFLERTPLSFQQKYRDVRVILFRDFNYSIHYTVEGNSVFILRILNQRQHF